MSNVFTREFRYKVAFEYISTNQFANEVAENYEGVSRKNVLAWRDEFGLTGKCGRVWACKERARRNVSKEQIQRVRFYYVKMGLTIDETEKMIPELSRYVIRRVLKDHDWTRSGSEAQEEKYKNPRRKEARAYREKCRRAGELRAVENLTITEIAERMGVSVRSVKRYLPSKHNPYPYHELIKMPEEKKLNIMTDFVIKDLDESDLAQKYGIPKKRIEKIVEKCDPRDIEKANAGKEKVS